ncbi:MAG: hypothetical protein KKA07_00205 [Bacteroidetes bacterium]|nr:hypothetical protein [Bacteroidota bacterium]MBU1717472.1 hypothetical protein [Bacteroidota bacterium]
MKKIIWLLFGLLVIVSCQKEEEISPNQLQYRVFNNEGGWFMRVDISSDNQFILSLRLDSSTFSLWKISSRGYVIWQKTISLDFSFSQNSIIASSPNHIFLVGELGNDPSSTSGDFVLIRLSDHGDLEWVKIFETSEWESRVTGMKTSDNNLILCGEKAESCYSGNPFFAKVNLDGDTLWSRTIYESVYIGKYKIIEAKDGSYLIYGTTGFELGDENGYIRLIKMDRNGNVLWETSVCKARWIPFSIAETTSGDILICGYDYPDAESIPIVCTDANGVMKWVKYYKLWDDGNLGLDFQHCDDRTFKIFGRALSDSDEQFGVIKIDESGNELHKVTYPSLYGEIALKENGDHTYLFWNQSDFLYMTKLDQNGNPVMLDCW